MWETNCEACATTSSERPGSDDTMRSAMVLKTSYFSLTFIPSQAPHAPGVYSIYRDTPINDEVQIYVGEAEDIASALLDHYYGKTAQASCIWEDHPTHFGYHVVWEGEQARREKASRLRELLDPICNRTR